MTRGLMAAMILGLAALPATAGDVYTPYHGCGPSSARAAGPVYVAPAGLQTGIPGNTPCETCNACGPRSQRDGQDRWKKFKDFLCYKPTIPCDSRPSPTPYTPPLRAWFPSRPSGPCATCGTGCVKPGVLGRRIGPCGVSCGATCATSVPAAAPVVLGIPAAQATPPRGPVLSNYYTTMPRPGSTVEPTILPQSYKVSKPANSTTIQDASVPPRPAAHLPGSRPAPRN